MLFRQLFDSVSSTYTYLVACEESGRAALIDPVMSNRQRDLAAIRQLGLTLVYTLDTHIHADHITAARRLKSEAHSRIAHPACDGLECAEALYRSVHDKLFTLPGETLVYPAHDYAGRHVSSIGKQKRHNPRLGNSRPLAEFVKLMHELDLDYPKFIDYALPGNRQCGICPGGVPDDLLQYCGHIGASQQG